MEQYKISIPDNFSISDLESIDGHDNSAIFTISRDNTVIGFVVLIPGNKDCLELKRLYLASSERRKGFGQFLLRHAINYARVNDYKSIRLETSSRFKEAVKLYEKHGFSILHGIKKAPGHDLAFEKKLLN